LRMSVLIQPVTKRIVGVLTTFPPAWSVYFATAHALSVECLLRAVISTSEGRMVAGVGVGRAVLAWTLSCYAVCMGKPYKIYRIH
jgi:hypothetical protein